MRNLLIFLAIAANGGFVLSFFLPQPMNETQRLRRSVENMEQVFFGSYNEHIESKMRRKVM